MSLYHVILSLHRLCGEQRATDFDGHFSVNLDLRDSGSIYADFDKIDAHTPLLIGWKEGRLGNLASNDLKAGMKTKP